PTSSSLIAPPRWRAATGSSGSSGDGSKSRKGPKPASGGLRLLRGPFATRETDRIEKHAAHPGADLPAHLRLHGPDPGYVQRDVGADQHRRGADRHEAGGGDILDLDLDRIIVGI